MLVKVTNRALQQCQNLWLSDERPRGSPCWRYSLFHASNSSSKPRSKSTAPPSSLRGNSPIKGDLVPDLCVVSLYVKWAFSPMGHRGTSRYTGRSRAPIAMGGLHLQDVQEHFCDGNHSVV